MASPNIFQSLLRPVKSVADYDADYDMAEGNKLKLAAARMGMEQSQRGAQQAEARRQAFAASGGNGKAYRNALQQIGDYAGVQEFDTQEQARLKGQSDLDTADVNRKKAGVEMQDKQLGMAEKRINIMGQSSKYLMDNPTLEGAMQVTQYLRDQGVIDDGMAQKTIAELQANPTPEYIRQRAEQAFRTALGAKEQLESRMAQNRGGTAAVVGVDPVTGKARDLQSAPITQSADNAASNARQAAEGAANRGVQMRGQNMADARARERLAIDSGTALADAGGPNQAPLVKRFGKPSKDHRWKADGSQEPIPGGPADIKSGLEGEKRNLRQQTLSAQADSVLDEITQAKKLVGWTTTGVGGLLANLPMTDARKLSGHVDTIKANLGFDRLQQMRDMSPTGGALGQVAVQELMSLQATIAKLDQLQDPRDVAPALDKIEKHYKKWKETLGGATGGASGSFDKPTDKVVDFGRLK